MVGCRLDLRRRGVCYILWRSNTLMCLHIQTTPTAPLGLKYCLGLREKRGAKSLSLALSLSCRCLSLALALSLFLAASLSLSLLLSFSLSATLSLSACIFGHTL